jgi:hypothetical protein
MRLWLSGVLNGSRKRLLLAYSKDDFNHQLKATELQLPRTELCHNTSVEFQIKVLPGIHFYQSDIPYVHINQENIWTVWTPSPELVASTPGRERINPPPPSPRNQSTANVAQTVLPQHDLKQEADTAEAVPLPADTAEATKTEAPLCKSEANNQNDTQPCNSSPTHTEQDASTDSDRDTQTPPKTEQLTKPPPSCTNTSPATRIPLRCPATCPTTNSKRRTQRGTDNRRPASRQRRSGFQRQRGTPG